MRLVLYAFLVTWAGFLLLGCGGGGGGGTGGGGGGGSNLAKLSVVAAFAPATRVVPGYADELHVTVTPPTGVSLPANAPSEFTLTRDASARDLVGLTPSAAPYTFNMEALTDGVVVGRVVRTIIVTPGMDEGIDVSAFLQSEVASVQVEGPASMTIGNNMQFAAHAKNADGQTLFSGAGFSWTSTDPLVLYVDVDTGFVVPRDIGVATIRATLTGTSKWGSLLVTISTEGSVSVSISPPSATLQVNEQKQFFATVNGAPGTDVTWSVDEPGGGTITAGGLYTTSQFVGTYHIRATSQVDPTASATAEITASYDAGGDWTVLYLHPPGTEASWLNGVSSGQQAGRVRIGGIDHASLWTGSAASWLDLHPGGGLSIAYGVGGGQQAGQSAVGVFGACLWTGSAGSWVDLHPPVAGKSGAFSVHAGQQGGFAYVEGVSHASLWTGTAASWVSLHPAGATASWVYGVYAGQQVGYARVGDVIRAGLWVGTPDSWVNLHPASSGATESMAFGVYGGQQVGRATINSGYHASLWSGSAASWVDLNPAATQSQAHGVFQGYQVGEVIVDNNAHASVWTGTASSWIDLHHYLTPTYNNNSVAQAVWIDTNYIYVAGHAYNSAAGRSEAVMWVRPVD